MNKLKSCFCPRMILISCLFFLLFFFIKSQAFGSPGYEEILAKCNALNDKLETFKVTIDGKIKVICFPIPVSGFLYYKKPDKLRLVIPSIPKILESRKSLFKEMVPKSFNARDYSGKVMGIEKINEKVNCYLVELIPRNDKKIKQVKIWVEKESYLSPKSYVLYSDGSTISSLQTYKKVESFIMPECQEVQFDFRGLKGSAIIEYKDYKFNLNVDSALSDKN